MKQCAKLSELRPGDQLRADGGFTCIAENAVCVVREDDFGDLFVDCTSGGHYLSGQTDDDGETLIGFERVTADDKPRHMDAAS